MARNVSDVWNLSILTSTLMPVSRHVILRPSSKMNIIISVERDVQTGSSMILRILSIVISVGIQFLDAMYVRSRIFR